jgi:hypothetical protein
MIVTVFRSRLNPGVRDEYGQMARRMSELVKSFSGYISHKGFVAEDGERVTIVEFEPRKPCANGGSIPNMPRPNEAASKASSATTASRSAA